MAEIENRSEPSPAAEPARDDPRIAVLIQSAFDRALRYARIYLQDLDAAEDVASRVMRALSSRCRKDPNYLTNRELQSRFISKATLHGVRDSRKMGWRQVDRDVEFLRRITPLLRYVGPHRQLEMQECVDAATREVAALPPACRQVYLLATASGLKQTEIAKRLGISLKTVEKQLSLARRKLRSALDNYLPSPEPWDDWNEKPPTPGQESDE